MILNATEYCLFLDDFKLKNQVSTEVEHSSDNLIITTTCLKEYNDDQFEILKGSIENDSLLTLRKKDEKIDFGVLKLKKIIEIYELNCCVNYKLIFVK